jgi:hypothetical protein
MLRRDRSGIDEIAGCEYAPESMVRVVDDRVLETSDEQLSSAGMRAPIWTISSGRPTVKQIWAPNVGCRTDGFPALRDDDSQRSRFTGSTPKAYRCRDHRAACHFVPDAPAPNNPAAELAASRP